MLFRSRRRQNLDNMPQQPAVQKFDIVNATRLTVRISVPEAKASYHISWYRDFMRCIVPSVFVKAYPVPSTTKYLEKELLVRFDDLWEIGFFFSGSWAKRASDRVIQPEMCERF